MNTLTGDNPALLKCTGNYKVVYNVTVSELVQLQPYSEVFDDMLVEPTELTRQEFDDEWSSLVVRSVIDLLPIYETFEDVNFYLGRWTDPQPNTHPIWGARVALPGKEMDNHGRDVTYIGWRVRVSAREVNWELD